MKRPQVDGFSQELFVAREAMEHGCNVSLPYGGAAAYDMLVERGGKILKIQVKSASMGRKPWVQEITGLRKYKDSEVDFFAGVVDVEGIKKESEKSLSFSGGRHVFYKEFDPDRGQTARVNYRQPSDVKYYNRDDFKPATDHDFEAKIEPRLGGGDS